MNRSRFYPIILFIVVLISYGQLLFMTPWQDDQSLFFKLQHINEKAGYFGVGPFGEGTYKYIITPFIPIYYIFGLNIPFYYALAFFVYLLSCFAVYKCVSSIINQKTGRISGLLYGAGYMASDSFIRLFNSIVTSFSVILISLLSLSYWKYYKTGKIRWYLFALVSYFSAIEFVQTRTHYLISVVLLFELLFFAFRKFPSSSIKSLFRLTPFIYLFYKYFAQNPDGRSSQIRDFINSLVKGDFYVIYGFLASLTNLVIPDWFTNYLTNNFNLKILWIVTFGVIISSLIILLKKRWLLVVLFSVVSVLWFFISKDIFNTTILNLNAFKFYQPFLGGIVLMFALLAVFLLKKDTKKLFTFFTIWGLTNLAAYSAYSPTVSYESIYRYLSHSFFAVVIVISIIWSKLSENKSKASLVLRGVIVIWGVGNLINAYTYQNKIVNFRSTPIKNFYKDLLLLMPKLEKGDLIYFDVEDNARGYFNDSFSVASMPEETAIAWRYRLDRYDFKRIIDFDELIKTIKADNTSVNKIHSFFYTKNGLTSTSSEMRSVLSKGIPEKKSSFSQQGLEIKFDSPIKSLIPTKLKLNLKANYSDNVSFPIIKNNNFKENTIYSNLDLIDQSFEYSKFKNIFLSQAKSFSSTDWREEKSNFVIDDNLETAWRPDRVEFPKGNEFIGLNFANELEINRFAFINAYPNNTPIQYYIDTSLDGKNWKNVASVEKIIRLEGSDIQFIDFLPQRAKYIRLRIAKSLSGDSPGISEMWVIPTKYSNLNLLDAEEFINEPFGFVKDKNFMKFIIEKLQYKSRVNLEYKSNKSENWLPLKEELIVVFDNKTRSYEITLPASGTEITHIRVASSQVQGNILFENINILGFGLKDLIESK